MSLLSSEKEKCPQLVMPDKQVPFGYWYAPNEEQLVQTLLEFVEGKLTPEQLSTDRSVEYATDTDTYGFHPRILNWDPKNGMNDNVRYCCMRRQKTTGNAKRKTGRKTGRGNYWKNTGTCDEVCGGKAQKLKLTLGEEEVTWIMHEYTLKAKSNHFQEGAICRIERKIKNNNDKEKGTASRIRKKRKEKGTEESGSGFNMQGQDCDEQKVDDDPTKNTVVEHESVTIMKENAIKNSSDIELLEENSKYTEESVRRDMQCLQDYLEQGIDDDPMININDYPLYKELKQILYPNNT